MYIAHVFLPQSYSRQAKTNLSLHITLYTVSTSWDADPGLLGKSAYSNWSKGVMLVYKGLNTSVKAGMLIILLLTSASYADDQGGKQSWEESEHKWLKTFFFARLERVKPDQRQPVLTVRQDDLTHSNSVWFEATAESTTASLRLHKLNLCDITRSVRGTLIWTNQRHHRLKLLPKQHMGCGWDEWQMLTDRNIWIH